LHLLLLLLRLVRRYYLRLVRRYYRRPLFGRRRETVRLMLRFFAYLIRRQDLRELLSSHFFFLLLFFLLFFLLFLLFFSFTFFALEWSFPFFWSFLNLKSKKNASCFRAATEKAKKRKTKNEKRKTKNEKRKKTAKRKKGKKKTKEECRLWISRRKAKWSVVR
jgi:hypothetical protein